MRVFTIVALQYNGIMKMAMSTFLCQNIFPHCYKKSQHPKPTKPQYAPHPWFLPSNGHHIQMSTVDESKKLDSKGIRRVKYIVGSVLYQSRALDSTRMVALNKLGGEQDQSTEKLVMVATCYSIM